MTDPWGDHALREHLRPLGREPFFEEPPTEESTEDPQPEEPIIIPFTEPDDGAAEAATVEIDDRDVAAAVAEALYGTPEVEPQPEPEPLEDPERSDPSPDSIAGKVLTVFRTFPKEKLRGNEIAETLGFETKQVYSAIEHLRRLRQPVFADSPGVYEYDDTRPIDSTVLRKSSWYKGYRPPKTAKASAPRSATKRRKAAQPSRENNTPNLLRKLPLHERAVILYEALQRVEPNPTGSVTIPIEDALNEEEQRVFPTKSVINYTLRYLYLVESVEKAGPTKVLHRHPNEATPEEQAEAEQTILSSFATPVAGSGGALQRTVPRTTVRDEIYNDLEVATPALLVDESLADDPIDAVDDDRLAHALANGMWTRYEWALTEIGRLNEQLVALQEGLRAREEENLRLRGYVAKHLATRDIKDIARELLTQDAGRG